MSQLKNKIISIFDVFVAKDQPQDQTIQEINRRGKIDMVKLTKIIFLMVDEIEELKAAKKK